MAEPVSRYGVASGDPLSDRVIAVVARRVAEAVTVEWTLARDERLERLA